MQVVVLILFTEPSISFSISVLHTETRQFKKAWVIANFRNVCVEANSLLCQFSSFHSPYKNPRFCPMSWKLGVSSQPRGIFCVSVFCLSLSASHNVLHMSLAILFQVEKLTKNIIFAQIIFVHQYKYEQTYSTPPLFLFRNSLQL